MARSRLGLSRAAVNSLVEPKGSVKMTSLYLLYLIFNSRHRLIYAIVHIGNHPEGAPCVLWRTVAYRGYMA